MRIALAKTAVGQSRQRHHAIDFAATTSAHPLSPRPSVDRHMLGYHPLRKFRREQHAISRQEPAALRETPMLMHERKRRNAIAIGENDVIGCRARQRFVADRRCAKARVILPYVRYRKLRLRREALDDSCGLA